MKMRSSNWFRLISLDGIDFQKIDELIGAGNSIVRNDYQAFDLSPVIGSNYYRLKQVDFDGNHNNSEVRHVFFEKEEAHLSIKIYPNPNKDRILNLEIEGISQDMPAQLTIHTNEGRLLETREISSRLIIVD